MALPGGSADKFGNRYEGRWTVACMLDILRGRAQDIWLEVPGDEGKGTEFRVTDMDGKHIYHQVKRQQSDRGSWSLPNLKSEGVLTTFWEKLQHADAQCMFTSTQAAFPLDKLTTRAKSANSLEEFEREFLSDSDARDFRTLRSYWGNPLPQLAFQALRRIHIEPIGEEKLQQINESLIESLVDGNPRSISADLGQLAWDHIHEKLTGHDIWDYLEGQGYHPRADSQNSTVITAVRTATNRYCLGIQNAYIAGQQLIRDEARNLLDILQRQDQHDLLLSGEAGIGKSGILVQVIDGIKTFGWPVLAFRVDRLDSTQYSQDIGEKLLGHRRSPVSTLGAIAQERDCLLVIDQLDAVSQASGRNPEFFDCIAEIIGQTEAYPQMRVLLGCRRFDMENDSRIKSLMQPHGRFINVLASRLSETTVRQVVENLGLNARQLDAKQVKLLSLPLHLQLIAETSQQSSPEPLQFRTAQQLYDRFWNHKQEAIRLHLGHPADQWVRVISVMTAYMLDHRSLSVPEATLDDFRSIAQAMASEHVLVQDAQRYAFFHEGFLDYAFARAFVARDEQLLPFLCAREQHLFYRALVRQILIYERGANQNERHRYLADLKSLLMNDDIRFHLKQVVFALLADLDDPSNEEWQILQPLVKESSDPCTRELERVLESSPGWFRLLDSLGVLTAWLASPHESQKTLAITILARINRTEPDRVAQLLTQYCGKPSWIAPLLWIVQHADLGTSRALFEILIQLIDQGAFDGSTQIPESFWTLIYSLPNQQPEWACEAIGHVLNRQIDLMLANEQPNPFTSGVGPLADSHLGDLLWDACALRASAAFVQHVLPFVRHVVEATADRSSVAPWLDPIWAQRIFEATYPPQYAILTALVHALQSLARTAPEELERVVAPLENSAYETFQYLVCKSYAANGTQFADKAVDYLCADPAHLQTGYLENIYWATRELLEAVTPYCSDDRFRRLKELLLNGVEPRGSDRSRRGRAQLIFLEGIAPARRTRRVNNRIQYLLAKFGGSPAPPRGVQMVTVESPISQEQSMQLSDEEWIAALETYRGNGLLDMVLQEEGRAFGGAFYVASQLGSRVKDDPERFARLATSLPEETDIRYADAILQGLAESTVDTELLLDVCRWAHHLPEHPCGRWLCRLIGTAAAQPLPDDILNMVAWYATEDPDPGEEVWRMRAEGSSRYYGGDITSAGINSCRGAAAEAIGELISHDHARLSLFTPFLEAMVMDRSIAVRSCVAAVLLPVLLCDTAFAISLFSQLCGAEDALLSTLTVEQFLVKALITNFEDLTPLLQHMLNSQDPEVQTAGSRLACSAGVVLDKAHNTLIDRCIEGTEAQRLGAAQILSLNIAHASLRSACTSYLIRLFSDPAQAVLVQAASCFRSLAGPQLSGFTDLVEAFVRSSAFQTETFALLHALWACPGISPDIVCLVGEQFKATFGSDLDLNSPAGVQTEMVIKLILRAYNSGADETVQSRCLDVIDYLASCRAYGLGEALSEYSR